jgi:hypothetical protein
VVLNSLFLFFRQKKSVTLIPIEEDFQSFNDILVIDSNRNASIKQKILVLDDSKLEKEDIAKINRSILEIFNWYALKFLSFKGDFDHL